MIWTVEQVERLADGLMSERYGRRFWKRTRRLRPEERSRFEQAKLDGYLVVKAVVQLNWVWWHYCGALCKPYPPGKSSAMALSNWISCPLTAVWWVFRIASGFPTGARFRLK